MKDKIIIWDFGYIFEGRVGEEEGVEKDRKSLGDFGLKIAVLFKTRKVL